MIYSISIENFRGIKKIEIKDFKNINIFVGKNNSGKTTILESIFLISGPTNPMLLDSINFFRGSKIGLLDWRVFYYNYDINKEIIIKSNFDNDSRELHIKLPNKTINEIKNEISLTSFGKIFNDVRDENFLTNLINFDFILEIDFILNKNNEYKSFILINKNNINLNTPINYKENIKCSFLSSKFLLNDTYRGLENILKNKKQDKIVKILQKINPEIINIQLIGNEIYFDIGLDNLLPLYVLGDGLIKILSIVVTIYEARNGIVLIDEIENGLYHYSQKILWEAIIESANEFNVQIFITTHSLECLKSLCDAFEKYNEDLVRLFRIEQKEKETNAIDYNLEILKESLDSGWDVR